MCAAFGRYSSLVCVLKEEIFRAVFRDYDALCAARRAFARAQPARPSARSVGFTGAAAAGVAPPRSSARVFFEATPHFAVVKGLLARRKRLMNEISMWRTKQKQMKDEPVTTFRGSIFTTLELRVLGGAAQTRTGTLSSSDPTVYRSQRPSM